MAAETIIQIRRGLAATWTSLNPILAAGEMGLETDTKKMKIGNGTNVWASLNYSVGQVDNINFSGNTISSVDVNGDITLDPNGTGDVRIVDTADLYVGGDIYSDSKKLATLEYVDAVKQGLDVKGSVRAATTVNISLSGAQTIDGVSVVATDRVLVKNQSTGSQNGIYVASASAWSRAADADSNDDVTAGMFTFVEEGTVNADTGWVMTNNAAVVLGTTALVFTQFNGAGSVSAGAGLTKDGNTLDVGGTADRITVNADSVDIASTYVGQSSIVTVGTVTTGTWNATAVAIAYGGTGATDAGTARTNLGVVSGTDVLAYDSTLAAVAAGTYSGDDSIVTVGTVTAGTWNGSVVGTTYGGTGLSSYASGDIIYASSTDTLAKLTKGTSYQFLKMNSGGTAPEWSNSLDGGTP